jgi:hypothetical protein
VEASDTHLGAPPEGAVLEEEEAIVAPVVLARVAVGLGARAGLYERMVVGGLS